MRSTCLCRRFVCRCCFLSVLFCGTAFAEGVPQRLSFLSAEEAASALATSRSDDYFERLQPLEIQMKTGLEPTSVPLARRRRLAREAFAAGTADFTQPQRALLSRWTGRIDAALSADYPGFVAQPWSFLKIEDQIEGGLPHTVGSHIVLSEGILNWLIRLDDSDTSEALVPETAYLLIHEQMHVIQRLHPGWFEPMFRRLWRLEHVERIDQPEGLRRRQMLNPDGLDINWIFLLPAGYNAAAIWPLLVIDKSRPNPVMGAGQGMSMVGIFLDETSGSYRVQTDAAGAPREIPLLDLPAYADAYLGSDNIYHPNESSADLFGRMVVTEEFGERQWDARFDPVRPWFRRMFAEARTLNAHAGGH